MMCTEPLLQQHLVNLLLFVIWQQLFDKISAMLLEELALLRTIGSTHLDSCQSVKTSSHSLLSLIEKLIPIAQNSKVQNPRASFQSLLSVLSCNSLKMYFYIRLHWIGFYLIPTVLSVRQVAVLISLSHSIWLSCYAITLTSLRTWKIKFRLSVKTMRKPMLQTFFLVIFPPSLKRYPIFFNFCGF